MAEAPIVIDVNVEGAEQMMATFEEIGACVELASRGIEDRG